MSRSLPFSSTEGERGVNCYVYAVLGREKKKRSWKSIQAFSRKEEEEANWAAMAQKKTPLSGGPW